MDLVWKIDKGSMLSVLLADVLVPIYVAVGLGKKEGNPATITVVWGLLDLRF